MFKILVCDDEVKIRETIRDYLSVKNIEIHLAENGEEAIEKAKETAFDLIVLDVMMPVKNGLDACREIRKSSGVPILFLSALGEENDLLRGYMVGADDYIVKPFPLSVLYEKCIKMIKRDKGISYENILKIGDLIIDLNLLKVYCGQTEAELSNKDFQLLKYLAENRGMILSREMILNRIWGYDFFGDTRVVDTHIKRIRKALGKYGSLIKTIYTVGYTIEKEEKK